MTLIATIYDFTYFMLILLHLGSQLNIFKRIENLEFTYQWEAG